MKIVLFQQNGIHYAEVNCGRSGARGTGCTAKEAIGDLILGSRSVLGIAIEEEISFMPPPAKAVCEYRRCDEIQPSGVEKAAIDWRRNRAAVTLADAEREEFERGFQIP